MRRKRTLKKKSKLSINPENDLQNEEDPLLTFWLSDSSKGKGFSYCKVCSTDIASKNGVPDIKKHAMGRKHKDNLSSKALQLFTSFLSMSPGQTFTKENLFGDLLASKSGHWKKKASRSPYRYNRDWERNPLFSNWVSSSAKGEDYAYCTLCNANLALYLCGINALKNHAASKKHMRAEAELSFKKEMQDNLRSTSKKRARSGSNESINDIDYVDLLSSNMLPDSEDAEDASDFAIHGSKPGKRKYTRKSPKKSSKSFGRSKGGSEGYYLYKYQKEWQFFPLYSSWLSPSKLGDAHAFCMFCDSDLLIMTSGRTGLDRHASSKKHKQAAEMGILYQPRSPSPPLSISVEPDTTDQEFNHVLLKIEAQGSDHFHEVENNTDFDDSSNLALESGRRLEYPNHDSFDQIPDSPCLEHDHLSSRSKVSNSKLDSSAKFKVKTNEVSSKKSFQVATLQNIYKYQPEWETNPLFSEWLAPSTKGDDYAYCKVCGIDIIIHNLGETNLKIHATTKNHNQRFNKEISSSKFDVGNGVQIEIMEQCDAGDEILKKDLSCDESDNRSSITANEKKTCNNFKSTDAFSINSPPKTKLESEKLLSEYCKQYGYKVIHKYNPRWELDPYFSDWLSPSAKGDLYASCIYCCCNLAIYTAGKSGLERHARTPKHKEKVKSFELGSKVATVTIEAPNLLGRSSSPPPAQDSIESFSHPDPAPKEKKKFIQYYNFKWERDPLLSPWLARSDLGREYAYCRACMKDLLIRAGRKADLLTHAKSKKHLRFMNLMPVELSQSLVDTNFLAATIVKELPRVEQPLVQRLLKLIVDELGVENKEDLHHLEAKDLESLLKPVQARRLIQAWRTDLHVKIKTEDDRGDNLEPPNTISFSPKAESNGISASDHSKSEVQVPPLSQTNTVPAPVDQVSADANTVQSFELATVEAICLQDTSTYLSPPKKTHKATKTLDDEINMKKSFWVDDFCVPSERLTPEVMNLLQTGQKLGESHMGDLVRAFANQIYEIVKKPHIDDLRVISLRVTDEFPCLKNTDGVCPYRGFFEKLKNRMYALRKRKSAYLRRERKKKLKQIIAL